jgi:integrase
VIPFRSLRQPRRARFLLPTVAGPLTQPAQHREHSQSPVALAERVVQRERRRQHPVGHPGAARLGGRPRRDDRPRRKGRDQLRAGGFHRFRRRRRATCDVSTAITTRPHRRGSAGSRRERSGRYRPKVLDRAPRCIPDERFDELFAQLGSRRDRALVVFWVSTGARASELLGATVADVDPGQQLITVIRKGTRAMQPLPAAADAFVWLRLYQVQLAGMARPAETSRCGGHYENRCSRFAMTQPAPCSTGPTRCWRRTGRCTICVTPRRIGWRATRRCG